MKEISNPIMIPNIQIVEEITVKKPKKNLMEFEKTANKINNEIPREIGRADKAEDLERIYVDLISVMEELTDISILIKDIDVAANKGCFGLSTSRIMNYVLGISVFLGSGVCLTMSILDKVTTEEGTDCKPKWAGWTILALNIFNIVDAAFINITWGLRDIKTEKTDLKKDVVIENIDKLMKVALKIQKYLYQTILIRKDSTTEQKENRLCQCYLAHQVLPEEMKTHHLNEKDVISKLILNSFDPNYPLFEHLVQANEISLHLNESRMDKKTHEFLSERKIKTENFVEKEKDLPDTKLKGEESSLFDHTDIKQKFPVATTTKIYTQDALTETFAEINQGIQKFWKNYKLDEYLYDDHYVHCDGKRIKCDDIQPSNVNNETIIDIGN